MDISTLLTTLAIVGFILTVDGVVLSVAQLYQGSQRKNISPALGCRGGLFICFWTVIAALFATCLVKYFLFPVFILPAVVWLTNDDSSFWVILSFTAIVAHLPVIFVLVRRGQEARKNE